MDRRSYLKYAFGVGGSLLIPTGVLSLVGRHGVASAPDLFGFDGRIMGTGYSVRLGLDVDVLASSSKVGTPELDTNNQLSEIAVKVHAALQSVDAAMSTWRTTSELSQFNDSTDLGWQPLSASTVSVIDHAMQTSKVSNGAFDMTVGPLVDLWGFGAGATVNNTLNADAAINNLASYRVKPSAEEIRDCMLKVGFGGIDVDLGNSTVRKRNIATRLDLSGIAKGFAVDQVTTVLNDAGFNSYLVEVGGELRSRGIKPNGDTWKVAIESPGEGQSGVFRILNLDNSAVATSGDYRNYFINGGQRYSHSIDPRTGQPVHHELASVSVIADSTMQADSLSTAFMVMGPDEALRFAEMHRIAVHLILKSTNGNLKEIYSTTFATHFS